MLKKDAFEWSEESESAFNMLKRALTQAPVLRLPDFGTPFVIETDACGTGIGAVLMQHGQPVAYFSKKLAPRLRVSSTYNKELHAVAEAVQKWRQYLLGRSFIIGTDQRSIKELLLQPIHTPEQQIHIRKLLGFDFNIEYKSGSENRVADALSRRDVDQVEDETERGEFRAMVSREMVRFVKELERENNELPSMKRLHDDWRNGILPLDWEVKEGKLFHKGRLYLSEESQLKDKILFECHSTPLSGHTGIARTLARVAANFFWKGMRQDVSRFINSCAVCQQVKTTTQPPAGLLQPLPVPSMVWEEITMDFVVGLPPSNGKTAIFVVVDRLTKFAHFSALQTHFTAEKVAEAFVETIVKLHGFPRSIVSDRDPIFLSKFWSSLFKLSGTKLLHSSAYHPQTDGQTEVVNRSLEQYLRCFASDRPSTWAKFLPWAEYCHNTSYHSSIQMTPFRALYGRDPPQLLPYNSGGTTVQALEEQLIERDGVLRLLKENILQAQHRMKQKADCKRREVEFQVGDKVLLKLQPYRQISLARRSSQKLAKRYFGPFSVLERVGAVAYRLALPPESKIHPVFHVSQLKPFCGDANGVVSSLPEFDVEGKPVLEPLAICGDKHVMRNGVLVRVLLVQWKGLPLEESTWESAEEVLQWYPELHLEDKVPFEGGRNDTNVIAGREVFEEMPERVTADQEVFEEMPERVTQPHIEGRPTRKREKPVWHADYYIPKA